MRIINDIAGMLNGKSILILGFGREGKSTYEFIKKYVKYTSLGIADKSEIKVPEKVYFGENYLDAVSEYDVVIKSPGIPFFGIENENVLITSQTELLLKANRENIIGITGTKGKSTTTTLIFNILNQAGIDVRLIGNIGVPPLSCLEDINDDTILVCEMSSHQLENLTVSPHIAIILNIFEEHLDHYKSYEDYQLAKVNVFRHQTLDDIVIYNLENELVKDYVERYAKGKKMAFPYDYDVETALLGEHNKKNIMAARLAVKQFGVNEEDIKRTVKDFSGLAHRLEFVGEFDGVKYYNDSISTIPEATINAINSIKDVNTVIIGGMDRGIHYDDFAMYLGNSDVENIILAYDTGKRIYEKMENDRAILVKDLEEAVEVAKKVTKKGMACLLSPAAASYGFFKNFEERGDRFKELVKKNEFLEGELSK